MYAVCLLAACVAPPPPNGVSLSDAMAFGVPDAGCALANYRTSRANPLIPAQWDAAWAKLAAALDESRPAADRLAALVALQEIIGDEWFYTGRMPAPVPPRRPWE